MDLPTSPERPLEYTFQRPRRHWIALALVVAGSLIVGFVLFRAITTVRARLPFLSAQRKCLELTFPSDRVAYEEDHAAAWKLAGGHRTGADWTTLSTQQGEILAFYLYPNEPRQFQDWKGPLVTLDPFSYFLFVHARQAKGGSQRLVHVGVSELFALRGGSDGPLSPGRAQEQQVLQWEVLQLGTLLHASARLKHGSWGDATLQINMPKPLRLYAGQTDPADESHFTIQGVTPQGPLRIDGCLQLDDTIQFQTR